MKNYVLRDSYNVYKKNVMETDDVQEWSSIKVALECYIEKLKGFLANTEETIKRIESGNALHFDKSLEETKEQYDTQLNNLINLKSLLASLEVENEIHVSQLEVKCF